MNMRIPWFWVVMATVLALGGGCRADVMMVKDGKPVGKIFIAGELPDEPAAKEKKPAKNAPGNEAMAAAVRDFVYHVRVMSGAELTVVTVADAAEVAGPGVVVGDLAVAMGAKPEKTSPSREGFRLLSRGDVLLVGGQSPQAAAHGLYEVLRRMGCDWIMPGEIGEVIPRRATVVLPALDESQSPDFQARRLWYRGYHTKEHPRQAGEYERFGQWLARHKGGGDLGVAGQCFGHEWPNFINRNKAEFEKDPTMFALRRDAKGELVRAGPQIEAVHPRVAELFAKEIESKYEANIAAGAWTKGTAAGFPIGPADGLGYSESPEAKAASARVIDPITGDPDETDTIVLLANRVLEKVHAKYPNAYVGFYSYSVHGGYPAKYKPDPKLVQIFAPINFSRYHSLIDSNSRTQSVYRGTLEKWGELSRSQGNPLTYRGYNWNLADNLLPYTKVRIWGEELPFYKKQNVLGMSVEATKMWSVLAASDYVFMRLCWDTSQDWRALLHEFCEKSYGGGAAAMERYHLAIAQRQSDAKQEAGSYHAFHLMYDDAWVKDAAAMIAEASAKAGTDGDRKRIAFTADNLEALRLYLAYHRASLAFDFPATKAAFDAMRAHWDRQYSANSDLVANEAPGYLNRYIRRFVEEGLKHSTEPYRVVYRVPDELPTAFDPDNSGEKRGFASGSFDDSGWTKTKTISSTWDAQRLTDFHRADSAWYRVRFTAETGKLAEGHGVGLFLGGFEDEARVWLNGKAIGSSGRRFSNPAEFDLTDAFQPGKENVLTIQVVRNSAANEIGLGGLIRPSFVFVGPRLPTVAPIRPTTDKQVLPGGEVE